MADLSALVSADWLHANLDRKDVVVLDGTWSMPGETPPHPGVFIPGAQVFDIDEIADETSHMKHMLPSAQTFASAVSQMGIKNTDHVIIYDRHGFFSAPRVWWTFRMFGHDEVSVLNGGLPAWVKAGYVTVAEPAARACTDYKPKPALSKVATMDTITSQLGDDLQILDARPGGRFNGTSPEPRAGLRSGHIPGSSSLPFGNVRTDDQHVRDLGQLAEKVDAIGIDLDAPIITSCGSGITAAGLAFILHLLGAKDVSVYDGSWTEWGASDAPVEL